MYEFRRVLKHFYPNLKDEISDVLHDDRRSKSCDYSMSELIMGGIMMYMLRSGSRNGVNELRDSEEFRKNYQKLLQLRIPHMDTVNAMLRRIEPAQLDGLLKHLVKILLSKRVFHKFRLLNKYFI